MLIRKYLFQGEEGFHIRPAAQFAKLAKTALSNVHLLFDGEEFNGKSPLSIMSACIGNGKAFTLRVDGPDEEAILALVEDTMVYGPDRYFMPAEQE